MIFFRLILKGLVNFVICLHVTYGTHDCRILYVTFIWCQEKTPNEQHAFGSKHHNFPQLLLSDIINRHDSHY